MRYVYPVVSRRAGGVSIGVNLNPNNACNWRCIYCQVPDLKRGGPPPVDLPLLGMELDGFITSATEGDFMEARVPEGARRLVDVAFSGNGEPTSASEFHEAVRVVMDVLDRRCMAEELKLRLITNGSMLDRKSVQRGIALIGSRNGEVWFKLDAATSAGIGRINGVRVRPENVARRLAKCVDLAATWIQTCVFSLDGRGPDEGELTAYVDLLRPFAEKVAGVHLYGLARPSMQREAPRLTPISQVRLSAFAARLNEMGIQVRVSP